MSDDPGLPPFPTDELTLGMVEHALDYCLTYEGESGEHLDEPRGIGAEFSLHSLLDFLSGTTTDPLGVVQHLGTVETFMGPAEMTVDERPHYTEKDIIRALIAEVRSLRQTSVTPPGQGTYRPCAGCDAVGDSCRAIGCPATSVTPPGDRSEP